MWFTCWYVLPAGLVGDILNKRESGRSTEEKQICQQMKSKMGAKVVFSKTL
jgi:hypothetical protein